MSKNDHLTIETHTIASKHLIVDLYYFDGFYFTRVWCLHKNMPIFLNRHFNLDTAKLEILTLLNRIEHETFSIS